MKKLTKQWGANPAVPTELDLMELMPLSDETWRNLDAIIQRLAMFEIAVSISDTDCKAPAEVADAPRWMPVSERPREGADIIVARITDGYRRWWKGAYIQGEFVTVDRDGEMKPFDTTHWMAVPYPATPLPADK